MFATLLFLLCTASATNTGYPYNWTYEEAGEKLNINDFKLIWSDDFTTYDITPDSGTGPWYAPVHSNYGIGSFAIPPDPVYNITNSTLTLSTRNNSGNWICSTMQTMNSLGKGFACQNCYFEFKAKLPHTSGAWAAFWLHSLNFPFGHSEIDILEYYGENDPFGQHHTMHIWPNTTNDRNYTGPVSNSDYSKITALSDSEWHLHGALLTNESVVIYFDRQELARIKRAPENQVPHYIILSMAMANQTILQDSSMVVNYVQVYTNETHI